MSLQGGDLMGGGPHPADIPARGMQDLPLDPATALERLRRGYNAGEFAEISDAGVAASIAAAAAGDFAAHSDIAYWLARCAKRAERWNEAMIHGHAALESALRIADRKRECLARAELTIVTGSLGQIQPALEQAYDLLALAAATDDAEIQACAAFAAGRAHAMMQQWPQAEQLIREGLASAQRCGNLAWQATLHHLLSAFAHLRAGDQADRSACLRLAREHLTHAQQLYERAGDVFGQHTARFNHTSLLHEEGDTTTALGNYEAIIEELGGRHDAVWIQSMENLGRAEIDAGEVDRGLARMGEALAAAEARQIARLARDCALNLSQAYERLGRFAEALGHHQRFHALYAQLASESAQTYARAVAIKHDTDQALARADTERQRAERLQLGIDELAQQAARLSKASYEDALTGLANRRRFDDAMQALALEPKVLCRVALLDIDHFKRINDGFSHLVGDAVLRRVGAVLLRSCRPTDTIARYGGEEFALIALGVSRETMRQICERLRESIAAEDWPAMQPGLSVTVSIGVAGQDELESDSPLAALMAGADRRLYAAKNAGRNRVVDGD